MSKLFPPTSVYFCSLMWKCFATHGSLVLHCLSPSAVRALRMTCYQRKVLLLWVNTL